MSQQTIGFIGMGVMGKSMAEHLLNAGYPVHVYNRTKSKADPLVEQGAIWEDSVKDIASKSDVIITIIGKPQDVENVYLSEDGIVQHAKPGSYAIDMTTSKPKLATKIYEQAKEKGIHALDAPVSGGDVGAKNAKLTIMVGGEKTAYDAILPIFERMGENIVLQGEAGAGQHTKMVNQIAIAPGMIGICEALLYAKDAGLDPTTVLSSIESGAAGSFSLSNYGPRIIEGDFSPGFAIKHFIKDMQIALESAEEMGLETPGLKLALDMYEKVAAKGEWESGTHALLKYYRETGL